MKNTLLRLLTLAALLGVYSCKEAEEAPASSVKADEVSKGGVLEVCPCNDLACWRQETKQRSYDSFKCAKDMIGTAFPVLDIPLSIGFGAIEIADATSGFKVAAESLKEGAQLAKIVKEFAPACAAGIGEASAGVLNLSAKTFDMVDKMRIVADKAKKGEIDFKSVSDSVIGAGEMTAELVKMALAMEKITACLETAKGGDKLNEVKKATKTMREMILKAQKPWGEMTKLQKFDVAAKLGKCGISIVKGAWAAGQNIGCMMNDFAEIEKQREKIGKLVAFDGSRSLNHARWGACRYCLSDIWYNSAKTDRNNCRACCDEPNNNPVPGFEPTKRGNWAAECNVVCGTAYTEGVFTNYTDARVCKERITAYENDPTGHVYRYIDLLDESERSKSAEEQKKIAGELRARAVAYIDVIRGNFAAFDKDGDSLIDLAEMRDMATAAATLEGKDEETKKQMAAAASFYGQETIVRQEEIKGDELPYIRASVGKPYFFVLLETASDGGTVDGTRYDDKVGTGDLDGFRNEIGQYKIEVETANP